MLPELIEKDSILKYFEYTHFSTETLQRVSFEFHELAQTMAVKLPRGPERTVVFRKLLEAKDAAVRAALE